MFQSLFDVLSDLHMRVFTVIENKEKIIIWKTERLLKPNKTVRSVCKSSNQLFCSQCLILSANETSMLGFCWDLLLKQLLVFEEGHGQTRARETYSSPPQYSHSGGSKIAQAVPAEVLKSLFYLFYMFLALIFCLTEFDSFIFCIKVLFEGCLFHSLIQFYSACDNNGTVHFSLF